MFKTDLITSEGTQNSRLLNNWIAGRSHPPSMAGKLIFKGSMPFCNNLRGVILSDEGVKKNLTSSLPSIAYISGRSMQVHLRASQGPYPLRNDLLDKPLPLPIISIIKLSNEVPKVNMGSIMEHNITSTRR